MKCHTIFDLYNTNSELMPHSYLTPQHLNNVFFGRGKFVLSVRVDAQPMGYQFDSHHPKDYGHLVEKWVVAHIGCPVCGAKLYTYQDVNMPIVDAICLQSENHRVGTEYRCFLFQIKSSTNTGYHPYQMGLKTAMKGVSRLIHAITPDDALKRFVPGYIFVSSKVTKHALKIDVNKSFFWVPKLNNYDTKTPYYFINKDYDNGYPVDVVHPTSNVVINTWFQLGYREPEIAFHTNFIDSLPIGLSKCGYNSNHNRCQW